MLKRLLAREGEREGLVIVSGRLMVRVRVRVTTVRVMVTVRANG